MALKVAQVEVVSTTVQHEPTIIFVDPDSRRPFSQLPRNCDLAYHVQLINPVGDDPLYVHIGDARYDTTPGTWVRESLLTYLVPEKKDAP